MTTTHEETCVVCGTTYTVLGPLDFEPLICGGCLVAAVVGDDWELPSEEEEGEYFGYNATREVAHEE